MIKIIIIFLLILNTIGCNVTKKNTRFVNNNYQKIKTSNNSTYLAANFYISKGDAYTASKILDIRTKNPELLQLKFFSNLVSGNFETANQISNLLEPEFKSNNLYYLPKYILNIKKNNFKENFELFKANSLNKSLTGLTSLINLWVSEENKNKNKKLRIDNQEISIHELLVLENFHDFKDLKLSADKIYEMEDLNSNDLLLLAGFYFRMNNFQKFKKIIQIKLSDQFDKTFIIKNFSSINNIFYKTPTLHIILASKLYNNSILNDKQNENSYSYQKVLLEMSLYLCPNLDIAKYSLAELYNIEKTDKIALKKLMSISSDSFFILPSNIKKLSIIKYLNNKYEYKDLLFRYNKKWPRNRFLLYRLATYYKSKKEYLKSIKIYKKILNIYGETDRDLFLYASNLDKIGKWEDAKVLFFNLLERNPKNTYSLNYVSYKLALRNQDLNLALDLIKQALIIDPENGFYLDTLGWVEFKRKNYSKAVFFLEKSVSILPKSPEILNHLGDCYLMLNRKNEALFEWNKALKYETNKIIIKKLHEKIKKNK